MSRVEDETLTPTKDHTEHLPTVTPDGRRNVQGQATDTPELAVQIRQSIVSIKQELKLKDEDRHSDATTAYMMMFNPRGTTELPTLRTAEWLYDGQRPSPISINKARKLLAAAYAAVPCEMEEAGVHGHAWIIEEDKEWIARGGTKLVTTPTKPIKDTTYEVSKQLEYADKLDSYKLYNHLMQEGKEKIIVWFGRPLFVDLHIDGILPITTTPKELLQHLASTYAQGRDHRRHMEQVEKEFNKAFDPTKPVEVYFMQLQEARTDADLLGQPYSDQQAMNKALKQFEKHFEKDAYKAEKRWNEKTGIKDWTAFKTYWKDEIHQWETVSKSSRRANQAVIEHVDTQVSEMRAEVAALQAENRSYQEGRSHAFNTERIQFAQALQAEQSRRQGSDDSVSTMTDYVDQRFNAISKQIAGLQANAHGSRQDTAPTYQSTEDLSGLLETARRRRPDAYKHLNEGKGKRFTKYCWHCGCNTTHGTKKCYELSPEQKARYGAASFDDTMGGSTKFLARRGHYQIDYGFDSL